MWHSMWHSFWHSIWHSFWHSIWHSIWHIFWHLSWGPAVPTDIGRWLLRSSGAHWDRELAVEVQQCPLRSGAGEEARRRRRRRRRKARRAILKSNNPHLAGGEQLPAESNGSTTLDNKWFGNCKKRGHCRLNFLRQFCTSREGTQQYLLGLHQVSCTLIWLQVIAFWGWPHRFTWFGAFSQHNWTLPY